MNMPSIHLHISLKNLRFSLCGILVPLFVHLPGSVMAAAPEGFLQIPNLESSSGYVVVKRLDQKYPTNQSFSTQFVTVYSWDREDFLAEYGLAESPENPTITNLLFSTGTYASTNWEYRNNKLILHQRPSDSQLQVLRDLNGRTPERHVFETIVARGMNMDDFKSVVANDDGSLRGMYQGKMPITLSIENGFDSHNFRYSYSFPPSEQDVFLYKHEVQLSPFVGGGFVPSHLKTWFKEPGDAKASLKSEYAVLAMSDKLLHSLSPFALYQQTTATGIVALAVLELDRGKIYQKEGKARVAIPGKLDPIGGVSLASKWIFALSFLVLVVAPLLFGKRLISKWQINKEKKP